MKKVLVHSEIKMVIWSSHAIQARLYQVIDVVDETTDIVRQPELFICILIEQIGIIPIGVAETNNDHSEIKTEQL